MTEIKLPKGAAAILDVLEARGHQAYVVGGCVRDSLLSLEPKDWDVCTSAVPQEIESYFKEERIIPTGLRHGTVTLLLDDGPYEVTTFRKDGAYSDNRRPDSVSFVADIREDLARRDFTINAMAYHPKEGLIDPFGGEKDLQKRLLTCVGHADTRFNEDALRIMRALRFASVYGFQISEETAAAIDKNYPLLRKIAAERIYAELRQTLLGSGVLKVLLAFSAVFTAVIPELAPCAGFPEKSGGRTHTLYDRAARGVAAYPGDDPAVKLALLLHDVGKPLCRSGDHAQKSRELAEQAADRLRLDHETKATMLELILYHEDDVEPSVKSVRQWLARIGYRQLLRLTDFRIADSLAYGTESNSEIAKQKTIRQIADQIIAQGLCFSLKDLAISGRDLLARGWTEGKEIGRALQEVLDLVIEGSLPNERKALLAHLEKQKRRRRL